MGDDIAWWAGAIIGFGLIGSQISHFINGVLGKVGLETETTYYSPENAAGVDTLSFYADDDGGSGDDTGGPYSSYTEASDKYSYSIPWSGPLKDG